MREQGRLATRRSDAPALSCAAVPTHHRTISVAAICCTYDTQSVRGQPRCAGSRRRCCRGGWPHRSADAGGCRGATLPHPHARSPHGELDHHHRRRAAQARPHACPRAGHVGQRAAARVPGGVRRLRPAAGARACGPSRALDYSDLATRRRHLDSRRAPRARGASAAGHRPVRVFVDTNVFVYLFDAEEPAKQQRAREVVSELMRTSALVLSSQVLSELYVTVTRKLAYPLEPDSALRALADLAVYPVVAIDAALVQRAAARAVAEQVAYWDALILEAAVEAGAGAVYSEGLQHGRTYRGVTVQDPFAA